MNFYFSGNFRDKAYSQYSRSVAALLSKILPFFPEALKAQTVEKISLQLNKFHFPNAFCSCDKALSFYSEELIFKPFLELPLISCISWLP